MIQDIADENFGDEEDAGEVPTIGTGDIKIGHISRVSISFDVQKVDE